MSMTALNKIDRFFVIFLVVIVLMGGLIIISFRGIFSALAISYDLEVDVPESQLRVDKNNLNQAFEDYNSRVHVPLQIK